MKYRYGTYVILESLNVFVTVFQQEAQGLGALLDKMEDNDQIELDNIEIYMYLSL